MNHTKHRCDFCQQYSNATASVGRVLLCIDCIAQNYEKSLTVLEAISRKGLEKVLEIDSDLVQEFFQKFIRKEEK